ncbi:MAG: helix-turn-helix domain-containing protein [Nanoarchaeota archaeon]
MWSLRFKVENKDSVYTLLSKNYEVVDFMYPLDYFIKKNRVHILGMHLVQGEENEVKKFLGALKKDRKIREFKGEGNKALVLIAEEEDFYKLLFSAEFYHPSPVIIEKGYETWHIACWDRKRLEALMEEIVKWKNKFSDFILISIEKTNMEEIYFPKIRPKLPEKQNLAFELALKRGYYSWPRQVDLGDLAKEIGISVSTFQENLRKAEAKLLPFFAK